MNEKTSAELRAGLEYSRSLAGLAKNEIAGILDMHPNTYRRKEHKPETFTLEDLLKLKTAFKKNTIDEIFKPKGEDAACKQTP